MRTATPDPAADLRPYRAPTALGALAALACVACSTLPVLITTGVLGAGAGAVVGRLPALAVVRAVPAGGTWWLGQRRGSRSCAVKSPVEADGCGCRASGDSLKITGAGRR
ncbi:MULTISPECIES: hypothetical protein [unclassified Streptomyces]|uniref:hypothetical protein n=1 Tax=unclassified Streptomyces TaxID=2593676 RepID=UPI0037FE2C14